MSKQKKKPVICPICQNKNIVKFYNSINVTIQPKLKKQLINESLFFYTCSFCSNKFILQYPFLYNDMQNNFMIYFIPKRTLYKINCNKEVEKFPNAVETNKRIVNSLESLKEKILILENGLDDLSIELYKLIISKFFNKERQKLKSIAFNKIDKSKNELYFYINIDNENTPKYQKVNFELYKYISDFIDKQSTNYFNKEDFFATEQNLIKRIFADFAELELNEDSIYKLI